MNEQVAGHKKQIGMAATAFFLLLTAVYVTINNRLGSFSGLFR